MYVKQTYIQNMKCTLKCRPRCGHSRTSRRSHTHSHANRTKPPLLLLGKVQK